MRQTLSRATAAIIVSIPLICFLFCAGAFPQTPGTSESRFDAARAAIHKVMEEKQVPSVSIAVAQHGKIIWEESFGWADREKMIRAPSGTLYSLASISKTFTATAVMRLVEQGKIDLDKPVNDYLGIGKLTGLAGDARQATIRRVLSHTAGLPLHYQFFYSSEPYQAPSMDETIARYGILVTPPGETYQYSNLGTGILGYIVARVSGRPYADFMRTEIFAPLGLTHTSIDIGPGLEPYAAQRYDSELYPIPFFTFDHIAAAAAYSSAHDLIRWGMFHLKDHLAGQPALLKDSTLDEMHQTATPPIPSQPGVGYGLGWEIQTGDRGYRAVYHGGGMPGVNNRLLLYPADDVVVVVLTNKTGSASHPIAEAVVAAVLPKYAEELHKENASEAKASPYSPTQELAGRWTGSVRTWEKTIPFSLVFQPDGDIHVKLGDQLETLLTDASFENSGLKGRFFGTIPTPDAQRCPHTNIILQLYLRGTELNGGVSAMDTNDLHHYALTSYADLHREDSAH